VTNPPRETSTPPPARPKRYWLWYLLSHGLRLLAPLVLKLRVEGVERIPRRGPAVLVGNHVNFIDPVLAYIVQSRYLKGMTAVENFRRPLFNFMVWAVDAIPVHRGTPDTQALRAGVEALQKGWALYVAPEGTRSHDGQLQQGHAGVVLILLRAGTQIPIYPIAYVGLERFWEHIKKLRRAPVRVMVGRPFYLAPPPGRVRQPVREQMVAEMMGQIAALLPPQDRGAYAAQVGKTPQYIRFEPDPEPE
jgi:1-acyl-sn-glycerol-3-phosphate acyltransferase